MAHLFRGLRFYVASTGDKAELEQLITENGGTVSDSPERATQLVDCDKLDARHLERISTAFITDSVAFRTLQDPLKYSGKIFTMKRMQRRTEGRGRMTYTNEDDARMLHFAKLRGWKAMESVPESVWRLAGNERVTTHSAQSMHEHFRKQLKNKTPSEQRTIMTKAAAMARAQLLEQEDEEEQEMQRGGTNPNLTGFSDVAVSADRQRASMLSSIETRLKAVQEEKFNKRTRPRKPTSPLRISQRRRSDESDSDTSESADKDTTSPSPKASFQPSTVTPTRATPAAPNTSAAISNSPIQPSSTTSVTPIGPNGGRQKRKRGTPGSDATISQQSSSSRQYSSDAESVESKGENGISFRSVWSELVRNHSKRQLLQSFFEAHVPPESQQSSTGPAVNDENEGDGSPLIEEDNRSESQQRMELATDEESDDIICQLQIDTRQDMPSVVHALYYCSGDVEIARAFLMGASSSAMWSPQDDLLLVNLVSEEGTDHIAVDSALTRGDFATMLVPRDSDAIFKRVQFLR